MKILRYLIFFSILSGIFFVIYRQLDKTGFHRWWMAFKTAAFIAAILAGLIPASAEAIEPSVNNNQVVHERVIGDREFNSFENNDRQVILAKTGDNAPSVPTSTGREQPTNFPSGSTGGPRMPHVNPYRKPPKVVDQELGAAANPAGGGNEGGTAEFDNQCPVPKT
jgi:hypothetical protein